VVAGDGAQAIDLALGSRWDLIVMDLALPLIVGWEAIERLKRDPTTRDVPIVAVTGHAEPAHHQRALDAGCDRYLTKPLLPGDLHAAIQELLSTREALGFKRRA
jgi:CheY-like chemotaxis protein